MKLSKQVCEIRIGAIGGWGDRMQTYMQVNKTKISDKLEIIAVEMNASQGE